MSLLALSCLVYLFLYADEFCSDPFPTLGPEDIPSDPLPTLSTEDIPSDTSTTEVPEGGIPILI